MTAEMRGQRLKVTVEISKKKSLQLYFVKKNLARPVFVACSMRSNEGVEGTRVSVNKPS